MRFVAASIVFFGHASNTNFFASQTAMKNFTSIFAQAAYGAVVFFFILSGFTLTFFARRRDTAGGFWLRRTVRVWPNHAVTFIAAYIMLRWVTHLPDRGGDAIANILLVHAWFPSLRTLDSVNAVTWSLAVEMAFYAAFPLLYRLIKRIRPEHLWYFAGAVVIAILAVPLLAKTLPGQPVIPFAGPEKQFWFIYFFPMARMLEFTLGMLLARIVATNRKLPLSFGGAIGFAIFASAVGPMFPWAYHLVAVMALPLGLVIAAAARADVEGRTTWLGHRSTVFFGQLAFAFYLWHVMVLYYGHQWLSAKAERLTILPLLGLGHAWNTWGALAVIGLLYSVTWVLAWVTYSVVEQPLYQRFNNWQRRRQTAAKPAAPPAPEVVAAA
jgi:peptidoglycan/LPS O-acetylase OafA/YrhL